MFVNVQVSEEAQAIGARFHKRGFPSAYCVFALEGEDRVVLERQGPVQSISNAAEWDEALAGVFPDDSPRYALVKFNYQSPTDGTERGATIFVMWCPGRCKVKEKMCMTMYCKPTHRDLGGYGTTIQAGRQEDLTYDNVLATVLSKKTVR